MAGCHGPASLAERVDRHGRSGPRPSSRRFEGWLCTMSGSHFSSPPCRRRDSSASSSSGGFGGPFICCPVICCPCCHEEQKRNIISSQSRRGQTPREAAAQGCSNCSDWKAFCQVAGRDLGSAASCRCPGIPGRSWELVAPLKNGCRVPRTKLLLFLSPWSKLPAGVTDALGFPPFSHRLSNLTSAVLRRPNSSFTHKSIHWTHIS